MDRAGMPVFRDRSEPVTDMAAAAAGVGPIGYPVMVMASATVISGAIRDNTRESGPAAGRRSLRMPQVTALPARAAGGLSGVMGHYL
jgi:hypothetical protein